MRALLELPCGSFLAVVLAAPVMADPLPDHDRARSAVLRGDFVPAETLVSDALRRHPGTLVEVELEGQEYEVEVLLPDGRVVELEYDARTGRLLETEFESP